MGYHKAGTAMEQMAQGKEDIYCSCLEVKCPGFAKMFSESCSSSQLSLLYFK